VIWVGQFGIADGEAREETPWVGVFPADDREEDAADLYVLVEPALPGSEEFCAEMKEALGRFFRQSRVSLTGNILRALRGANDNLREWNKRSLKEHQVAAGVTCLGVRENVAYLAQVGPSRAVFFHNGGPQEIKPVIPEASQPLGLEDEFWPEFHRFDLAPGDRMLLLSPGLAQSLPGRALTTALALEDGEQALPELYKLARGQRDCAAVLLAMTPEIAPSRR
jgi:serine/threonine protein phosphatase PrpC